MFKKCKALETLLEDPRVDVNAPDMKGRTALHHACQKKDIDIVRTLLADARVNARIQNNDGDTSLHVACYKATPQIVKILLDNDRVDVTMVTMRNNKNKEARQLVDEKTEEGRKIMKMFQTSKRERDDDHEDNFDLPSKIGKVHQEIKAHEDELKSYQSLKEKELISIADEKKSQEKKIKDEFEAKLRENEANYNAKHSATEEKFNRMKKGKEEELKNSKIALKILCKELSNQIDPDTAKDEDRILACPICFEKLLPPKRIYTCENGHPTCSTCLPSITACP